MITTVARFLAVSLPITAIMTLNNFAFSYDLYSMTRATDLYGPAIVKEGTFTAKANITPWSSYWFPTKDPVLFKGENSPLNKYDRFVESITGTNPQAAKFEEDQLYDPDAASWAGLCTTWSLASIMEPEPKESVRFKIGQDQTLEFSSGDLKALLIQTYTQVEQRDEDMFGQRFDGLYDSIYADIFPVQFHRLLQAELFEKKLPFIIDIDAGIEVWNAPVWYSKVVIKADPQDEKIVHVTTDVHTSSDEVDYNFRGVKSEWRRYTYDLIGTRSADGQLLVEEGQWTGHSKSEHPDYVRIKPSRTLTRASFNKKIDPKMVDLILKGE